MRTLLMLLAMLPSTALAIPLEVAHQGRLFDATALPLDGPNDVVFALYDTASGGTAVWTETQDDLDFDNGYFATRLTALDEAVFDGTQLWLGISVNGGTELDRVAITTAPYAFRAGIADGLEAGAAIDAASVSVNGTEIIGSTGMIDSSRVSNLPNSLDDLGCSDGQFAMVASGGWACVDDSSLTIDGSQLTGTIDASLLGGSIDTSLLNGAIDAGSITGTLDASLLGGTIDAGLISGDIAVSELALGSETLDEALLGRLTALFDTGLHAPADGGTLDGASPWLMWTGAAAPFLVELDSDPSFGDPFTATTTDNTISVGELHHASASLSNGDWYWRVTGTGFGLSAVSPTRSVTIALAAPTGEPGTPGTSCMHVRDRGDNPPSGLYSIDPDGPGPRPTRDVYCEMDIDGGGWMLAMNLDTSDGNIQWYNASYWTDPAGVGAATAGRTADFKDGDLFENQGAAEIMIQVHEEGTELAWRSWNQLASNVPLLNRFSGGNNVVITAGTTNQSVLSGLDSREPMIGDVGELVVNYHYGNVDRERFANNGAPHSDNAGGGLGTFYDTSTAQCSRPCSDAQMTNTSTWASGTIGTDIDSRTAYGSYSGEDYDYAIYLR